ncbi:MAG TPA: hypothetical protein VGQ53_08300 [Chitinophagaceae bacterium]|jgi:hypothetical protein|nr:hypothetical protein [Chitinophagaceae bacterium]
MNSKNLMISSAIVTGLLGLTASFLPTEILKAIGIAAGELPTLFVQITGALYLGFAIMNWMAKTVLIGGIYARPLGMGNFLHFTVAALALLKFAINNYGSMYIWAATITYSAFAILFGLVVFTSPKPVISKSI